LPIDFDILASSRSHQPWPKICFGNGSPADIRKAGQ